MSSGAKAGMFLDAASSATESNQMFSDGSSLWVNTAEIVNPFLSNASIPVQPILW